MSEDKDNVKAKGGTNADGDYDIFRRIANDSTVNLQFKDVTYEVMDGVKKSKVILNGVSGEFRSGELSAIMGPSGCGKTTLLNLISGYRIHKTSGHVNVNDVPQNINAFQKVSRYIMQDDNISPHFTVWETMMFASKFKLGSSCPREQRITIINDILKVFHLQEQTNTMISHLSGGERKRVCIALELLGNPAVLFLDEPTTGLDESSASQCIALLRRFAKSGRTVICSIHGPSARLSQMFDKMYVLAEGQCIYQGSIEHVVPYLQQLRLQCPVTYNPADFIIEVSTRAYGDFQNDLVNQINNGKITKWLPDFSDAQTHLNFQQLARPEVKLNSCLKSCESNCSWWLEYMWILRRVLQQMWRDKNNMKLRISMQVLTAAMIGWAYAGIGNNAKFAMSNYYFLLLSIIKFVHMSTLPLFAHVPLEMQYLRREYFNQWYRLSAYFIALVTSQIPMVVAMSAVCSAIMYFISSQPMELQRFLLFLIIITLTSLVSSIFGICIGSRFGLLNALFMGPNITAMLIVLANYGVERPQPTVSERILMYSSYMRHSMEGLMATLYEFDRTTMECPSSEIFCLLSKPRYILKLLGYEDINYMRSVLYLLGFYALFMALAFLNFKIRFSSFAFLAKNRR